MIAKVVRELAASGSFDDFTSLKDALRRRLLRLRVRYHQREFDDALSIVQSNAPLIAMTRVARRTRREPSAGAPVSRQTAAAILKKLGIDVSAGCLR